MNAPGRRGWYVCQECDYRTAKWFGRCPECAAWDSFAEAPAAPRDDRPAPGVAAETLPFPEIAATDALRVATGLDELDRVLGGGLVPGSVVLVGGEPGIGKSTLVLQAAAALASRGGRVVYASGEESAAQLRARGDRLGVTSRRLLVATSTAVDGIVAAARAAATALVVVDSIQTMRCPGTSAVPGSVSQVREAAARFVEYAKACAAPVVLVGHVTKDGSIAGPRALEHLVDTVIQFEGDRHHEHRILRALKNRFGAVDELGVFRMTGRGLEGVPLPSELLLADRSEDLPGSAVLAAVEGTRPLLVEIQALVGPPVQGSPRRTSIGVDPGRVALVLAVLQRETGCELANRDVFVNVTGGLCLSEPAADFAVAAAVMSSAISRPVPAGSVLAGEIGLNGEIRPMSRAEARLREAARLGFTSAYGPLAIDSSAPLAIRRVRRLAEGFRLLFD